MIRQWIAADGGVAAFTAAAVFTVAFLVFAFRMLSLRRMKIDPADFAEGVANALSKGGVAEALAICEDAPGPVPETVAAVVRCAGAPRETMLAAGEAARRAACGRLERMAAPMGVLAQTAPLLGLAGTIALMMHLVADSAGDAVVSRPDLMYGLAGTLFAAGAGIAVSAAAHFMFAMMDGAVRGLADDAALAAAGIAAAMSRKDAAGASAAEGA